MDGSYSHLPDLESPWRAPLFPVMIAATAGAIADHYGHIPCPFSLLASGAALVAWFVARSRDSSGLALVYLWFSVAAVFAARHHVWSELVGKEDISNLATHEAQWVRARGTLSQEPSFTREQPDNPLRSMPSEAYSRAILDLTAVQEEAQWQAASGQVLLIVSGSLADVHVGDELEVAGLLSLPRPASNPGEVGQEEWLHEQQIRAVLVARKDSTTVTRLARGWPESIWGWAAAVRGWGQRQFDAALPEGQQSLAKALVLGEGSGLSGEAFDKYRRTGILYLLAISGQHLAILAVYLRLIFWFPMVRRSRTTVIITLFMVAYALLIGFQPSIRRPVVMLLALMGGSLLRRPPNLVNSMALAWIVLGAWDANEWFRPGCQLSFLGVLALYCVNSYWTR